ncbi:MAG: hypothetical protein E6X17_14770 [Sporomusaceae bacterium]|nr:hypothetical protein [Sporomusaceae bacterium]
MREFWRNFRAWLRDEKTRFDMIDRLRALLFLVAVMWLVKQLLDLLLQ